MFTTPFPWYVQVLWAVLGSLIIAGGMYAYSNGCKAGKETIGNDKIFDPQEPSIDIELVFKNKKND